MGLVFHLLRNDRAVPPWIAADREVRQCADAVAALLAAAAASGRDGRGGPATRARFRARLQQALGEHARAVDMLNTTAPSVTLHRMGLDGTAISARLERALDGDVEAASPT